MNPGLASVDFSVAALTGQIEQRARADAVWQPFAKAKGERLFDQDNAPADLFVLTSGLVKLFFLTPQGDERIKSLIVDQGLFAADDSGARFAAQALEPSTLARLPLSWVQEQSARDVELAAGFARFTDWVRRRKARREQALLCESAAERYLCLCRESPELVARLSQGDIARYLAITPIAFSRIKRRIARTA